MPKLGVGFNVFSGAELLIPAIRNARRQAVHHMVVVWQRVSNTGVPAPAYLERLMKLLTHDGIQVIEYMPTEAEVSPDRVINHNLNKREIGRQACEHAGCEWYMCRDCDEFYDQDIPYPTTTTDISLAKIMDYVGSPLWQADNLCGYYVPLMHRCCLPYTKEQYLNFRVDPGRRVEASSFQLIRIIMHHMTRVRYDHAAFDLKYKSHSWYTRTKDCNRMTEEAKSNSCPPGYHMIQTDQFGILDYWENEWPSLL